jgi:DNA-binding NarL/FixJ family response regulator
MASSPTAPNTLSKGIPNVDRRPIRILIALTSPMDCQLLTAALKHSRQPLVVVAIAVSREGVLSCFSRGNIDVALISADLENGPLAGLSILPELHRSYAKTPLVTLLDSQQDELVVRAFQGGATGVFCRSVGKLDMLWKCIKSVHDGQVWADNMQLQLLLRALRGASIKRTVSSPGLKVLATREAQVASLVADGLQNREVAKELGITAHTVGNYLFRIYNKLGISNRVELVLYVMNDRQHLDNAAAGLADNVAQGADGMVDREACV